jgi:hypothetical protein
MRRLSLREMMLLADVTEANFVKMRQRGHLPLRNRKGYAEEPYFAFDAVALRVAAALTPQYGREDAANIVRANLENLLAVVHGAERSEDAAFFHVVSVPTKRPGKFKTGACVGGIVDENDVIAKALPGVPSPDPNLPLSEFAFTTTVPIGPILDAVHEAAERHRIVFEDLPTGSLN